MEDTEIEGGVQVQVKDHSVDILNFHPYFSQDTLFQINFVKRRLVEKLTMPEKGKRAKKVLKEYSEPCPLAIYSHTSTATVHPILPVDFPLATWILSSDFGYVQVHPSQLTWTRQTLTSLLNFQALVDTILTISISTWQQCSNTQWIQEGVTIEEIAIHRIQINTKCAPLQPTTLHFDLELMTFHPKYISCYVTLTFFLDALSKYHFTIDNNDKPTPFLV